MLRAPLATLDPDAIVVRPGLCPGEEVERYLPSLKTVARDTPRY